MPSSSWPNCGGRSNGRGRARDVPCPVAAIRQHTASEHDSSLVPFNLPDAYLSVVDLRPLELVGIVDVNRLPLGEEIDGGNGGFAMPVAGMLRAAKWQMRFGANRRRVNVNDSSVQIARGLKGAVHVARINRSGEPIGHTISYINGFVQAADGNYGHNGAEDFFLRDAHTWRAITKNGRLVEPAFGVSASVQPVPSRQQLRAFVLANLHVTHHRVQLLLVDARPHFRRGIQPVANSQRPGALDEARNKLFVNTFVHRDAARRGATLPRGAKPAPDGAVNGELQIRVVHHDDDVLAAHLQAAVFEIRRTRLRNDPAH